MLKPGVVSIRMIPKRLPGLHPPSILCPTITRVSCWSHHSWRCDGRCCRVSGQTETDGCVQVYADCPTTTPSRRGETEDNHRYATMVINNSWVNWLADMTDLHDSYQPFMDGSYIYFHCAVFVKPLIKCWYCVSDFYSRNSDSNNQYETYGPRAIYQFKT